MAKNLNVVVVDGNLTKDIELNEGRTIGRFTLAVNESTKGADGQYTDYANFLDCKIFGKTANSLAQYLTKGKRVSVKGRLHQDRWEKDGVKNSRVVINVDEVFFTGSKKNEDSPSSGNAAFPEDVPF